MSIRSVVSGAVLLGLATGQASAATMEAIITGSLVDTADVTNLLGYGSGVGALNGQSIEVRIIYDTTLPGIISQSSSPPSYPSNRITGGSTTTPPSVSPITSMLVKIGGGSFETDPTKYSQYGYAGNGVFNVNPTQFATMGNGGGNQTSYQVNYLLDQPGGSVDKVYDFYGAWNNEGIPLELDVPFILVNALSANGNFVFNELFNESSQTVLQVRGTFLNSRLEVRGVSTVPIPAALPLLASGLGALGFIGWRRKRRAGVSGA